MFSRSTRRRIRNIAIAVAAIAGLRALLPIVAAAAIRHFGASALGRVVELENVDLALHRLAIELHGLRVGGALPAQGEGPPVSAGDALLSVDRVATALRAGGLFRGEIHLAFLEIGTPELRLQQDLQGQILPFVLAPPAPEAAAEPAEPGAGLPIRVDRLQLDQIELRLATLEGAATDLVDMRLAQLSVTDLEFRDGLVRLGAVALAEPRLRVRDSVVTQRPASVPVKAAEPPTEATPASRRPGPQIQSIEIPRAEFVLVTDREPLDVALAFSARNLRFDPDTTFPVELGVEIAEGRIDVAGDVGALPPHFDGRVHWEGVRIPVFLRSLDLRIPLEIRSVQSAGDLNVLARLQGDAVGEVLLGGDLRVHELAAVYRAAGDELEVQSLALSIEKLAMPIGVPQATAELHGSAVAEGIELRSGPADALAQIDAFEAEAVRARIPVADARGTLHVAGIFRTAGVVATTGAGESLSSDQVELQLRQLVAPLAEAPETEVRIEADFATSKLSFRSPAAGADGSADAITATGTELILPKAADPAEPITAQVALFRMDRPQLRVRRTEIAPHAGRAPAADPTQDAATEGGDGADPQARVAKVEVRGGALEWVDESIKPVHRSRIRAIRLDAADVRWPEPRVGELKLRSEGPAGADLRVSGALAADAGAIDLTLQSLGLGHFASYVALLGYEVASGNARLSGDVTLQGERIRMDTKLVLEDLDLAAAASDEFEREFGVPIGLAVALLKDPFGNIKLPVRVDANRDELRAAMVPLVLSTLRQTLVGALTSPLSVVQALLPDRGGGEGQLMLPAIGAAPGAVAPSPDSTAALEALAGLLAQRPQLGLVIRGRFGQEDREPLARTILAGQIADGGELPEKVEAGFLAKRRVREAIEDRGAAAAESLDAEDREVYAQLVAATEVPEQRQHALAAARAEALRDELVQTHGVATERLELALPEAGAPGVVADLTVFEAAVADRSQLPAVGSGPELPESTP